MNFKQIYQPLLLLLVLPLTVQAGHPNPGGGRGGDISVSIVSDDRGRLKEYKANSRSKSKRSYVEAQKGERYKIKIRNNTNRRIGLVIAVDGRNIISGKKSYLSSKERMYVLKPWKSATYDGWRRNKHKVNRFYFTKPKNSYADNWGDRSAMGVIAVAAFKAKPQEPLYESNSGGWNKGQGNGGSNTHTPSNSPTKPSFGARRSARGAKAGTGYGESSTSHTRKVKFEPKRKAFNRQFIKYEWREKLCQKGLMRCYEDDYGRGRGDNRFWNDDDDGGYAPPPRYIH